MNGSSRNAASGATTGASIPNGRTILLIAALVWFGTAADSRAESKVELGGIVNVVGQNDDGLLYLNTVNTNDSNFDRLRARLFIEGGPDRTKVFLQFLMSDSSRDPVRFFGGYIMHRAIDSKEVYLQAGKIPSQIGIWAPKTYADKNSLVSVPLAYFYKSTMASRQMPVDLDQLLSKRGQGQTGVAYTDSTGAIRGIPYSTSPIVYDNCWDYGFFLKAASHKLEFAVGSTLGAPGVAVAGKNSNDRVSLQGRIGYAFTPAFKVYLSGGRGAYLSRDVAPYLPAGKSYNDYAKTTLAASAEISFARSLLFGEVFYNHFETPLRADGLANWSYYLQARQTLFPGWYVAGRFEEIRYQRVDGPDGSVPWDDDVRRIEAGFGYHWSRDVLVKLVGQVTDAGRGFSSDTFFPALQVSLVF